MPAAPKVSAQQIVAALTKWRGELTAAAADLGIHRNALNRRIKRLGLDVAAFRNGAKVGKVGNTLTAGTAGKVAPAVKVGATMHTMHTITGAQGEGGREHFRPKNAGAHFTSREGRSSVAAVSTAVAQYSEPRPHVKLKVPPDHVDRLTQAKYDMQALLRRDLTEDKVLEMCLDEVLEDWIAQKLAALRQTVSKPAEPAAAPARRKAKVKP
jgi:hypothetical protein